MEASRLRHIIKFETPTTATDGMGGKVASGWAVKKTCYAHIVSNGGDTSYENGQTRGVESFTITCRFQKDYTITNKTRVRWGSRILTPNVAVNLDTLQKFMTFEATEFTG